MTAQDTTLYFVTRDAWRAWLEEHHATAKEAWLLHYKKHTGKPGLSLEIDIHWITSAKTDTTRQRRIQETVRLVAEDKELGRS